MSPLNHLGDAQPAGTFMMLDKSAYPDLATFKNNNPDWYCCNGDTIVYAGSPYDGQALDMNQLFPTQQDGPVPGDPFDAG